MEVDKGSDQKSDIQPHWMAAHARLKNEFTENEKCHYLMTWLKYDCVCLFVGEKHKGQKQFGGWLISIILTHLPI